MQKRVQIERINPLRCKVCGSLNTDFAITYLEMVDISSTQRIRIRYVSCSRHVVEVTAIVLKEAGLMPADAEQISTTILTNTPPK